MIDFEMLAKKLDFDLEDVYMLVNMFIDSSKDNLEDLKEAILSNNFQEIKNASHAIKGSSSNLLLTDIEKIASEIETMAKDKKQIEYMEFYDTLKKMINAIEIEELAC